MKFTRKLTAIILAIVFAMSLMLSTALAAPPLLGSVSNGQWKMTVANIDLLTLSTVPSVERKVLIDADNIWPFTDAEKEEFTVPVGTVITYQSVPNPMALADFGICKLFYVRTQDGLDFYSEYSEVDDETGECYGDSEQIYFFKVTDDAKKTSFTFTETGLYGVNAGHLEVPGGEGPDFPDSTYLVINVVGNSPESVEKPSSWAEVQVGAAIDENLVPQSLQSKYTQTTTRAEFCALAVRLYETVKETISERKIFTDTTDENVQKMGALGVVTGVGNDRFDPNGTLTREQAATMLSRLALVIGKPLPEAEATFSDKASISTWAFSQVGQVQGAEIMGGVGNNTFAPKGSYTREQSIVTILRLFDFVTFTE